VVRSWPMKFLVTGGTGFIGASVVANLLARNIPVVVADVQIDQDVVEKLNRVSGAGGAIDYLVADVAEVGQIQSVFDKHPDITHCIHLAYVMSAEVEADQLRGARVNVLGMANMFEAALRHKLQRLVFTSSETVYGARQEVYGGNHAVREDEYCDPQHHFFTYGLMKILNEFVASKYVEKHGISIACTRPPVVFGHGRKRGSLLWSEQIMSLPAVGKPVTLPFPAETRDCWIYKDHCAEQLVRLTLKPRISHLAYNNGGESVTAAELAGVVRQWLPRAEFHFEADKPGTPYVDNTDGTRLAQEIDYRPPPLAEGVRAHINEARAEAGLDPV
jgi:nucleoside-diphosphate-sugar epimerase